MAEKKTKKKETKVPAKFKKLVDEIEKMSVLEMAELVEVLEDKFGVTASAPVAAAPAEGAAEGGTAGKEEEKSAFAVHLAAAGDQKINVIKIVKEIAGIGLKDAKDLVDSAPKDIKTDVKEFRKDLQELIYCFKEGFRGYDYHKLI